MNAKKSGLSPSPKAVMKNKNIRKSNLLEHFPNATPPPSTPIPRKPKTIMEIDAMESFHPTSSTSEDIQETKPGSGLEHYPPTADTATKTPFAAASEPRMVAQLSTDTPAAMIATTSPFPTGPDQMRDTTLSTETSTTMLATTHLFRVGFDPMRAAQLSTETPAARTATTTPFPTGPDQKRDTTLSTETPSTTTATSTLFPPTRNTLPMWSKQLIN